MARAYAMEHHQRSYAVFENEYSLECTKYFERDRAAYTGATDAVYRTLVLEKPQELALAVQVRQRLQNLIRPAMSTKRAVFVHALLHRCVPLLTQVLPLGCAQANRERKPLLGQRKGNVLRILGDF